MFSDHQHGPDCWKCSLNVEWHDCSWCPAIVQRRAMEVRRGAAALPLPSPSVLRDPDRRKNLPKPMKKTSSAPRRSGAAFTLVELLTVIAIIGILAAMLMPVLAAAKKHAKIAQAKTEIQGIVTAISGYDQDYSRFPVTALEQAAAGTSDFTTGMMSGFGPGRNGDFTLSGYTYDNNSNTVAILMDLTSYPTGNPTANFNHQKNPKQVKYLNAKMSGDTTSPGVGTDFVYRDPWGNPYIITMNTSYSEQGTSDWLYSLQSVSQQNGSSGYNGLFNPTFGVNPDNFLFHGKVMVWSAGPDGKYSPLTGQKANVGDNKDNVLSWQ